MLITCLFLLSCNVFYLTKDKTLNLTLSTRQVLDSFKLNELADYNFKFEENEKKFCKKVQNTVGKGAVFLFSQCFQKTCTADM